MLLLWGICHPVGVRAGVTDSIGYCAFLFNPMSAQSREFLSENTTSRRRLQIQNAMGPAWSLKMADRLVAKAKAMKEPLQTGPLLEIIPWIGHLLGSIAPHDSSIVQESYKRAIYFLIETSVPSNLNLRSLSLR